MDDKAMKAFIEEYEDQSYQRREREVTQRDLLILMDYKKNKLMTGELMKKHKMTRAKVLTSLRLAALSKID